MKTLLLVSFVSILSFSAVACSSSTEGTGTSSAASSTDTSSFSDTVCEKLKTCDSKTDIQTCKANLESDSLERLRGDFTSAVATCISNRSCGDIGGHAIDDCFKEAAIDITPSESIKSFCHALQDAAQHCDADIDYAKCLTSYKQYSDDEATKLQSCTTKSCNTMVDCIQAETK